MEQLYKRMGRIEDKVDKILVQTTRTNGRVDNHDKVLNKYEQIFSKHESVLTGLSSDNNKNKGRDKVIWVIITAVGAVALVLIGYFLK